jgi:hypothetical protein
VVGIGQNAAVGSRKNQHLSKFPYHNEQESKRIGRGSSGPQGSNDLMTKEQQREMRTSSATAGNTNTEFTLLNEGNLAQGPLGNSGGFAIPAAGSLNFNLTS